MLALGLCGCNTEELEDIHNRLTALEEGTIPSVNQQITGIQGTIPQLQAVDTELRALIDALEENLAALTDSLGKANATVEAV